MQIPYVACCDADGNVTEESLKAAKEAAAKHEIAVVVAGLPDAYESEALDRENMMLPKGHNRMIEAVSSVNDNTVVLLLGGSAMEIPWEEKVKAILYMGLPGQAGGEAAYNLLTGKAVPSGKLTETWPLSYQDVASRETFEKKNVEYREGIYVGYRYYDKADKEVRYPFGYGLSYTTFAYSDMKIQEQQVSVTIKNTGAIAGAEVVQLYIAPPEEGIFRPKKGHFTLDNTCMEMKDSSVVMKIQYKVTENIIAKSYGGKKDMSNPSYRMTLICAVDCPLRAAIINSGGTMNDSLAKGLLQMANGHYLKGIAAMLGK